MGEEQRELFLRVIRPGDPGNPWRKGLQVRNYALLMVLYEHGLRISDVQQLRTDDLRLEKGLFTIAERIADPEETRRRRPNPKRRGHTVRTLRFTPESLEAMKLWLAERAQRDKWPGATRNAFVFVSHMAKTSKALSTRRPGQLFQDLRKAYPEKRRKGGQVVNVGFNDDYFHPHALRHDRAVRFVLDYYAKHHKRRIRGFTQAALRAVQAHPWPGNVRELESCIHRALLLCSERVLHPSHLQLEVAPVSPATATGTRSEMERRLIFATLERLNGNRSRTAEAIGVSVRTIRNRLRQYRQESALPAAATTA